MTKNGDHLEELNFPGGDDLPPIVSEEFTEDNLRAEILWRTTRTLRRRVWTRRTISALALVLVYGAGLATPGIFARPAPSAGDAIVAEGPVASEKPPFDMAATLASADAVGRHVASLTPAERVRFYQDAGDWYLDVAGDPARAAGCYRQMLIVEARLGLASEDTNETWMLASLRREQRKDVNHVR